jgi:hypothetical protein
MLYQHAITVPPNTPVSAPISQILYPTVGLLVSCDIHFPDGCDYAVFVQFRDRSRQFAPLPSGQWLSDNNRHVTWNEKMILEGPPWELIIVAYSEAIDWPHTITCRFEMGRVR